MYAGSNHKRIIQERKKREKGLRIESILEAAKKVFFSRGYLKATMDEIALEAEISKPTIYQYFRTKDDLYFSLMLPVVEDIGIQMEKVEKKLVDGKYGSGAHLIKDFIGASYHSYKTAPDVFRIVQLFQQTGLVWELNEKTRSALNERGGYNFQVGRRIMETAIKQGLIKKVRIYELVDVIWGLFVGIVQLEDIKSRGKQANKHLKSTLKLAETMIVDAITIGER